MADYSMVKELAEQDNAHTAHPMFLVQESVRMYGFDPDYACAGGITECWIRDGEEEDVTGIEHPEDDDNLTRTGYVDTWTFVTAFFTRAGAEHYIHTVNYRHKRPLRVYVESAYNNPEWIAVREYLLGRTRG